jgi:hypothetical protein
MKTIAIILIVLALSLLMVGCAKKAQLPPLDPPVEPAVEEATEEETVEELDEVFVEDEEIDIGELY